jgi:hypothetical protein
MKKLVVLFTLAAATYGYSQSTLGAVTFVTRGGGVDAIIRYGDGGPVAATQRPTYSGAPAGWYITDGAYVWGGPNARVALYAAAGTDLGATLSIITPSVPFKPYTGTTGGYAGYVDAQFGGGSTDRQVPGTEPSGTAGTAFPETAVFQIKAWDTGLASAAADNTMTFEQARDIITANGKGYFGTGAPFGPIALGGGSVASAYLAGAAPFTMNWVPEPSIIGLGILGAIAGMVVFRRRQ